MQQIEQLVNVLKQQGIEFCENERLQKHTTFKIGGMARIFCSPKNTEEITVAIQTAQKLNIPVYLLGKGSNILFTDDGYNGMIICIGDQFSKIKLDSENMIAQAGAELLAVCRQAQKTALAGMEFTYGIPGNIGGAIYMNAGAYGGEMRDIVTEVTYLTPDGVVKVCSAEEAEFGYRTSIFQNNPWVILSAKISLTKGNVAEIKEQMQDYMARRKDKQPLEYPSAGSAFKRPVGAFAGALIDECGLRGFSVGDAAISQKHCGFIVNLGNATCQEVLSLADTVSKIVKEKTGFTLEKEIRVVSPTQNFLENNKS